MHRVAIRLSYALLIACSVLSGLSFDALAQEGSASPGTPMLRQRITPSGASSGPQANGSMLQRVTWRATIRSNGASWMRLWFEIAELGPGSFIRVIGVDDGAVQTLDQLQLSHWGQTTAYFNGDAVRVELVSAPGAVGDGVRVGFVWSGDGTAEDMSQCGPTDDRLPSTDPRSARVLPIGCTVFMIDDPNHCFLTAGHCASGGNLDVVQFNVPPSDEEGNVRHPGPEDQYPVDPDSIQFSDDGVGNDWCYFGCFSNSETDLTPFQAQGDSHDRADAPPAVDNRPIRITGYGADNSPPQRNQTQQTHDGPFVVHQGTRIGYRTDTEGGNSGSGVQDDTTGLIIGIHTHGGCDSEDGSNSGTAINNAGLVNALSNPRGVCRVALEFDYPDGRPDRLEPSGGTTLRVEVSASGGQMPLPGTGVLHVNDGKGFIEVPMHEVGENVYDAVFPPIPCGTLVRYFITAETTGGAVVTDPSGAPATTYTTVSAAALADLFSDDFETDRGWTIQNVNLIDGAWERAIPHGAGDRGDPPADFDATGAGFCLVTDNQQGNSDVDGGPTRATSPDIDLASAPDAIVLYAAWFANDDLDVDRLDVEVSTNGGSTWIPVTAHGPTGGWKPQAFLLSDIVQSGESVRLRFSATDNPNDSVTEAGVDAVGVRGISCGGVALTGFSIPLGSLLGGDLDALRVADDIHLRTRSGFGNTLVNLHSMDLIVNAITDVEDATAIDLAIESRLASSNGLARVSLRNANTGLFEQVGQYAIGTTEERVTFADIPAANRISDDGEIGVQLRHVVVVPIFAFQFESRFDLVELAVR